MKLWLDHQLSPRFWLPWLTLATATGCADRPEDPLAMSPADSAVVLSEVIAVTLAELAPESSADRVWAGTRLAERPAHLYEEGPETISPEVRSAIQRMSPNVRFVDVPPPDGFQAFFDCREGLTVHFPGSGCAVKENGVVVLLGPLWTDAEGRIWTQSAVFQSGASLDGERSLTWAEGFQLRLEKDEREGWRVTGTTEGWIS